MCASDLPGDCGNLVKVRLSDGPSDKRVFRRTKSYPMEKKLRHDKQLGFNSIRDVCKRRAL